jgi:hypothetical protein
MADHIKNYFQNGVYVKWIHLTQGVVQGRHIVDAVTNLVVNAFSKNKRAPCVYHLPFHNATNTPLPVYKIVLNHPVEWITFLDTAYYCWQNESAFARSHYLKLLHLGQWAGCGFMFLFFLNLFLQISCSCSVHRITIARGYVCQKNPSSFRARTSSAGTVASAHKNWRSLQGLTKTVVRLRRESDWGTHALDMNTQLHWTKKKGTSDLEEISTQREIK